MRQSDWTILNTVAVQEYPEGLVFDGANMWVANYGSSNVSVIDAATATVMVIYADNANPGAMAFGGTNIWVASFGTNTLLVMAKSSIAETRHPRPQPPQQC